MFCLLLTLCVLPKFAMTAIHLQLCYREKQHSVFVSDKEPISFLSAARKHVSSASQRDKVPTAAATAPSRYLPSLHTERHRRIMYQIIRNMQRKKHEGGEDELRTLVRLFFSHLDIVAKCGVHVLGVWH